MFFGLRQQLISAAARLRKGMQNGGRNMGGTTRKSLIAVSGVLTLIVFAMCLRYFTRSGVLSQSFGALRNVIHISLLAGWGISLQLRIIQTQVRRYLLAAAMLMTLWLLLKIINYSVDCTDINRRLWYLYYVPMLFIPLVALFVSMSMGKTEDYRLPRRIKLLYVPTALLLLLVLTNDLHRQVFSFPARLMSSLDYRHEAGYYLVLVWIMLCALASLAIMLTKCRIPRSKKILVLPFIPLALSLIYTAAYIRGVRTVLLLAGDMTVTQCLLIAAMFEGCIGCGLIQSNIGYSELLRATTIPIQITDAEFTAKHASAAMQELLPQNKLREMTADTVLMNKDTLLKRHPLQKGWVFWKEDISELNRTNEELELARDELKDTGDVLAEENAQREKLLHLTWENRLYDMIETQTARQVAMLRDCLNEIRKTDDTDRAKKLLGQTIIIGTYIKRRNNLIFVGAQHGTVSAKELGLCLNESMENLNLYGVECRALVNGDGQLATQQAAKIYDLFEAVTEAELHSLKSLLVFVEAGDSVEVNICADGKEPLDKLKEQFRGCEWTKDEDGLNYVTLKMVFMKNFGSREAGAYGQN